jgi:hypothetical protein
MAITVEDGSNVPGAEAYADVAYADDYFSKRGNAAWAALNTSQKEIALRKGGDYMLAVYRDMWAGTRVWEDQYTDWPRDNVYRDKYILVANNIVPDEVKRANCELALKSTVQDLLTDQSRLAIREKVGPLEVEYGPYGTTLISYVQVANMLAPFLSGMGSGETRLIRA